MKPFLLTAAGNPENQDRGLIIHNGPDGKDLLQVGRPTRQTDHTNRARPWTDNGRARLCRARFRAKRGERSEHPPKTRTPRRSLRSHRLGGKVDSTESRPTRRSEPAFRPGRTAE